MWIVRLALKRPYTFTVMAVLIVILGIGAYLRMAKDIFPSIDIPVVTVVWQYGGLVPDEMEKRIVSISERAMTTTVNDIEHLESQTYNGIGVIKVFFQPGTSIDAAVAQVTAINQTIIRILPPGGTPPFIVRYSASNVPILQLGLSSRTLSEQSLFDFGLNFLRVQLATVQGASVPVPSGGKQRQIQVDIDPQALQAYGLTPAEVSAAINAQSLALPSGTVKIGPREYGVQLNGNPDLAASIGDLPIRRSGGALVYVRDVAQVRDAYSPQTSMVRMNGRRGTLISILKSGSASTLDVVRRIGEVMPRIKSTLPPGLEMKGLFDQSLFVRAALNGVYLEGGMAAGLTALMILLFLGTWRNTLVVVVSIPLSILCSIICLYVFRQTINVMTLGGLALAVGILVDDATVTIENIDRNIVPGRSLISAILLGAQQIAVPAFVSTLCICVVFLPVFFLSGTAHYLFGPLAMAVIFAMLASYFLSRTVVPTFVHHLLRGRAQDSHGGGDLPPALHRVHAGFIRQFERLRESYVRLLGACLARKRAMALAMGVLVLLTFAPLIAYDYLGRDFFPLVDAGQFRLHVRASSGTRIEETERVFSRVEAVIRQEIPADELTAILDNIGLPYGGSSIAFSDSVTIGPSDGEILVSLNSEHHGATWGYVRRIRARLNREFPGCTFFTQPSDIVGQILNFGLPAPIDIQIAGRDREGNYRLAQAIARSISEIPGAVDVHVHQVVDAPYLKVNVDRARAEELGLAQSNVASNLLITLSGSGQTSPNFWLNPQNGVQYIIATQTPQFRVNSVEAMQGTPVGERPEPDSAVPELLGNVASVGHTVMPATISHYDIQPVFDVYANVDGTDLGSVYARVRKLMPSFEARLARGNFITLRGQVKSMDESFMGLGVGVLFAILLVYLIMVINFQSWLDPFIIIMALPGALCGIMWALFLTHTTLSVPSLMGAIMSVGVATANSILVVTFANDQRREGKSAHEAALAAGFTRLRPVMMTALAMILGMLPMSLGLGEGGEQNAPLGRAVIGGLVFATAATLLFVPVVYAALRRKAAHRPEEELEEEMEQDSPSA